MTTLPVFLALPSLYARFGFWPAMNLCAIIKMCVLAWLPFTIGQPTGGSDGTERVYLGRKQFHDSH